MKLIAAFIIGLGITVAVLASRGSDPQPVNTSSTPVVSFDATPSPASEPEPTNTNTAPVVHPVSIPALMEYQLTGRDLHIGQVLSTTTTYTRYYITYKSDDLTISGILNIPKGAGPWPVLFLNHGHIDTSVYTNGRGLKREQDYFSSHGYAVLHSDYRCHAESDCPDSDPLAQRLFYAKDVMNAVAAVKAANDPRFDTTRLGMLGHSMGGGVTQAVVTAKPDLIQAAVLYAPVSSDYRDSFERYTQRRLTDVSTIESIYGKPSADVAFWDNLAPRKFFDRITAPLLYFQGTNDDSVPKEWSDESVELLKAANKDVTYVIYQGQPHEFTTSWTDFMQQSTAFFDRHVVSQGS